MQTDLETEIQSAWTRAHTLLSRENADADEIAVIVGELRNCAEQIREKNLAGERELWWLIKRLASLTTGPHTPTYLRV
jgi:hypothetical protein